MVLALAAALVLVRGGYDSPGQLALAALAVGGLALARPRPARDPLFVGLCAVALASLAAAASAGGDVAPALAACALPALYLVALEVPAAEGPRLLVALACIASASAAAGLAGVLLRVGPYAERIAGLWRAGGTPEYPPALAVLAACGLVAVLALAERGDLERLPAGLLAALLAAGLLLTFDRAGVVLGAAALAVLAVRAPRARAALWPALAVAAVALIAALLVVRPGAHAFRAHLSHGAVSTRTPLYRDAWDGFRQAPLLGYGPGRYTTMYAHIDERRHVARAHDQVLEEAVEAGVVAAAGAALALAVCLVRGLRGLRSRDPEPLAWALVALLVSASALYDFTWSYAPIELLALLGAARLRAARPRRRSRALSP